MRKFILRLLLIGLDKGVNFTVKHDFDNWLDKVKNNGIVMLHDTYEKKDDFGVNKLWDKLKKKYSTIEFYHSHGLGVLFKNKIMNKYTDFEKIW